MLAALEEVLTLEKPDLVLVYGDTNSTLAGALAASKLHLPVGHVEAGLRSFNRRMPEEINRVLTDHVSDCLFAPTGTAVYNLQNEGISSARIHQVGDVMYDAAVRYGETASRQSLILDRLELAPQSYILATVHRAENTDSGLRLETILSGLAGAAPGVPVVFPVHPRTRKMLADVRQSAFSPAIRFIDPVGYLDMIMLEKNARLIATDSGGVQKEAFFYRVPCVTLREETEWTELVDLGWNRLAPPLSPQTVSAAIAAALRCGPGSEGTPYGDGHAAERIVQALLRSQSPAVALNASLAAALPEDHYVQTDH
jgi:UDP-GlcNAc3NAcA epimerase